MRPFLLLALSSLASAIDAEHQPEWVKSVVASASSVYAPYVSDRALDETDETDEAMRCSHRNPYKAFTKFKH